MKYITNIGLEVHVELLTRSKLFCGCSTNFGSPPNTQTCPICLGLPGVLPVINKKALEYTITTALALNCQILRFCRFARKNYYYPDLPKNYQISQYEEPIAREGRIQIKVNGKTKPIRIERVHLEEDAGKLIHGYSTKDIQNEPWSFVDCNRTGIPLMEIVSYPDIHSPEEAYQYLTDLKKILQYLKVSDCNMEEGSLRCDANISLTPREGEMGVRTELKNMNSFKDLKDALISEVKRQAYLLDKGERVVQETRLWDIKKKKTISMRSKEEAHDYRYFPEPDLLPLKLKKKWIEKIKRGIPELPSHRFERFVEEYKLPPYDAEVLTNSRCLADYFEECVKLFPHPKLVSNWVMGELLRLVKREGKSLDEVKITPAGLAEILSEVEKGTLSGSLAKESIEQMFKTGKGIKQIIEEKGLRQINNEESLREMAGEIIKENPKAVKDFQKGKKEALEYLIGQLMKKTKGKANPKLANKIIREKI
ncbi:Asp-tRNA(Asn)/Glu-tRNA(Gln) amidotransferase subunit GatB [Patescibacteria group bacterium]|nr:Asp-tRNA(Asn)/Glu-tRNA(Gln) amidotransferase subunit GatB [Patescibacteria group bacterium]